MRVIFIFILLLSASAQATVVKRAFVLGIDGLRGDVLQLLLDHGDLPHVQSLINHGQHAPCKSVTSVHCARTHAGASYLSSFAWNTGPGWGSVISGLDANRHLLRGNGHDYLKTFADVTKVYPTIFGVLKQHHLKTAAAGTASFLSSYKGDTLYPGVVDYECGATHDGPVVKPGDKKSCNLDHRFAVPTDDRDRDNKSTEMAIQWIKSDVAFIMLVLDQVDWAGHNAGFDFEPAYIQAIKKADLLVGRIERAILKRVALHNEEWLVILTSDHGGHNQSKWLTWLPFVKRGTHAAHEGKDTVVPYLVARYGQKSAYIPALHDKTDVRHFDTFKTVAAWFGLDRVPTVRARDGRSRI